MDFDLQLVRPRGAKFDGRFRSRSRRGVSGTGQDRRAGTGYQFVRSRGGGIRNDAGIIDNARFAEADRKSSWINQQGKLVRFVRVRFEFLLAFGAFAIAFHVQSPQHGAIDDDFVGASV